LAEKILANKEKGRGLFEPERRVPQSPYLIKFFPINRFGACFFLVRFFCTSKRNEQEVCKLFKADLVEKWILNHKKMGEISKSIKIFENK